MGKVNNQGYKRKTPGEYDTQGFNLMTRVSIYLIQDMDTFCVDVFDDVYHP